MAHEESDIIVRKEDLAPSAPLKITKDQLARKERWDQIRRCFARIREVARPLGLGLLVAAVGGIGLGVATVPEATWWVCVLVLALPLLIGGLLTFGIKWARKWCLDTTTVVLACLCMLASLLLAGFLCSQGAGGEPVGLLTYLNDHLGQSSIWVSLGAVGVLLGAFLGPLDRPLRIRRRDTERVTPAPTWTPSVVLEDLLERLRRPAPAPEPVPAPVVLPYGTGDGLGAAVQVGEAADDGEAICAYCQSNDSRPLISCPDCHAKLHEECLAENRGCTTLGCPRCPVRH